jgi:quinoprotein glucose dehydrogenase
MRAFDAKTGKVLWTGDLSENGRTVPITYLGRSGKQYVAVMAAGGKPAARTVDSAGLGGRLFVFGLPDEPKTRGLDRAIETLQARF